MKRVVMYQAEDGTNFGSETEAKQHEMKCVVMDELRQILAPAIVTGRPEAVVKLILEEEVGIRQILSGYHKKLPKKAAA